MNNIDTKGTKEDNEEMIFTHADPTSTAQIVIEGGSFESALCQLIGSALATTGEEAASERRWETDLDVRILAHVSTCAACKARVEAEIEAEQHMTDEEWRERTLLGAEKKLAARRLHRDDEIRLEPAPDLRRLLM
jgi:hypothetical protein